MAGQRDQDAASMSGGIEQAERPVSPTRISRRALMGGASVALPTILTLNSSAAFGWAATSATIATRPAKSVASGDAICVQGGPPRRGARPGVHPVRTSDFYRVRSDHQYFAKDWHGNEVPLNPEQACTYRGEIYYRSLTGIDQESTQVRALNGAVASLAQTGALASLSSNGVYPTDWPI